MSKMYKKRW